MSDPLYLQERYRTSNEPRLHPLVRNSFAFVPSAGMRLAPEVLVLELMRELFFKRHYEATGTRDLDPDAKDDNRYYQHSDRQRAVLHALRGRRKRTKQAAARAFFAPAYPDLARGGWLGKQRERVVLSFLLSGPVAQYLWGCAKTERGKAQQAELAKCVTEALRGRRSCVGGEVRDQDILAATLGPDGIASMEPELPERQFKEKTDFSPELDIPIVDDELAGRIGRDLRAICSVEGTIPRMQWLHLLMTFLRFALPMWLTAHMRITGLLHAWLIEAVDSGRLVDAEETIRRVGARNRRLLRPTLAPTRELFEHIERYMKSRVEVSVLLYSIEQVFPDRVKARRLALREGNPEEVLPIDSLLVLARDAAPVIRASARFKEVAGDLTCRTFLTREGEEFAAWRSPLTKGQGKNIDEFFRVLYRAESGDEEGGFLLTPEGRGVKRGFRVFPGQLLLKTLTYLAAQGKKSGGLRGGGKLVLQDVEDLFGIYGVDFSAAADARPLLMRELQAMGLLTGSPDAGSSVAVACPY